MKNGIFFFLNGKGPAIRFAFLLTLLLGFELVFWTPLSTRAQEGGGNPAAQCESCTNCCPSEKPGDNPGVNPTSYDCVETADSKYPKPKVTPPQYCPGEMNGNAVNYTVGEVEWDPELPEEFTAANCPTFTSTAYVNVTSSDPTDCPSPGRVNIGSCTWNVIDASPRFAFEWSLDTTEIASVFREWSKAIANQPICEPDWGGGGPIKVSAESRLKCCDGNPVVAIKLSGGGSFELPSLECNFPFAGVPYVLTANVALDVGGSLNLNASGETGCHSTEICLNYGGDVSVGLGVSIVVISPKVIRAAAEVKPSFSLDGNACFDSTGYTHGGIKVCGHLDVVFKWQLFSGKQRSFTWHVTSEHCTTLYGTP